MKIKKQQKRELLARLHEKFGTNERRAVKTVQSELFDASLDSPEHDCPLCGRNIIPTRRRYLLSAAKVLKWAARETDKTGLAFVTPRNYAPREIVNAFNSNSIYNRVYELMERGQETNTWRVTEKGWAFLRGDISIPSHFFYYNDTVLGFDDRKLIRITDVIKGFSLAELLSA